MEALDSDDFCHGCGRTLSPQPLCTCGQPVRGMWKHCVKCGHKNQFSVLNRMEDRFIEFQKSLKSIESLIDGAKFN